MTLSSLEPGSAEGEKGKKRGQIGKLSASEVRWMYPMLIFAPSSHNAKPGPKLDINILLDLFNIPSAAK